MDLKTPLKKLTAKSLKLFLQSRSNQPINDEWHIRNSHNTPAVWLFGSALAGPGWVRRKQTAAWQQYADEIGVLNVSGAISHLIQGADPEAVIEI
jgi:hypothetical protein